MQKFIILILLISLGLNAYLFLKIKKYETSLEEKMQGEDSKPHSTSVSIQTEKTTTPSTSQENIEKQNTLLEANNAEQKRLADAVYDAPQDFSEEALFRLIQRLQVNQQYTELTFPLREYLRRFPNDYRAWLIEADLTLHTQPLNIAIALYYGLLEKNLPEQEIANVKSIIEVNTSKVVKQLSGDTAWNLLATFIEPLLQIDPLNHRYIMSLAKAYGKQEQLILMENVLAALPYDDARAQALRQSIYQPEPADPISDVQSENTDTASLTKRKVAIIGNGEQFLVSTEIDHDSHLLLIDTGASTTAISEGVFTRIPSREKEFVGRFNVQTAGGSIQAPLYRLSEVKIGQITINNVSVIVLPEENFTGKFQGLLGMNVLRNFEIRFDPAKQKMTMFER
jgi:clan AA aspartic protease (TIGR02281 family)